MTDEQRRLVQGALVDADHLAACCEKMLAAMNRHPAPATPEVDCAVCTNRGGLYGLSQETNCEHCLWQGHWHKKDLFAAPEPKP